MRRLITARVFSGLLSLCLMTGMFAMGGAGRLQLASVKSGSPTWTVVPSPNDGSGSNALIGLSCLSSGCVAVGFYTDTSGVEQSLVESWNGTAWTIVSSPDEGAADNELRSVSCTASDSCVAVGWFVDSSNDDQTLVESWNGTAWTIVSSPNTATNDYLNSVSCYSGDCAAVGYDVNGSDLDQTLIETFDGTSWSITTSPEQGTLDNVLNGVTCTAATDCIAVGYYIDSAAADSQESLVESFDGSPWTVTPAPVGAPGDDYELRSISCASATSCFAVGAPAALIEYWDGSQWSVTSYHGGSNWLFGVSCVTSTSCIAVGTQGGSTTLLKFWDGFGWLNTTGDNPDKDDFLSAVDCTSSTSCIAVGNYYPGGNPPMQNLVEAGPIPPQPEPEISSFSPKSGAPGTQVRISGSGLADVSSVTFDGVPGTVTKDSPSEIKVTVPPGAQSGKIKVTVPGGNAKTRVPFRVT